MCKTPNFSPQNIQVAQIHKITIDYFRKKEYNIKATKLSRIVAFLRCELFFKVIFLCIRRFFPKRN